MTLKELNPQGVWQNFYAITQIPRPSGKKEEISQFIYDYGKSLGLETLRDAIGNVLIRKPASAGLENHAGVILQAHMDMVPQKEADKVFDFEKDAIEAYIDGDWVTADGTTLGADNGIGCATAMAVLADKSLVHPPLEAFFTVDEETGMYGAFALEGGFLQGKTLLNLDSEEEGELYVGCAGGVDGSFTFDYIAAPAEEGDIAYEITVKGCQGGHSGCDINLQRANANKLLVRILKTAVSEYEARLAVINGGSLRNSIPREASAVVTIPQGGEDDLVQLCEEMEDLFLKEYAGVDDGIEIEVKQVAAPDVLVPEEIQDSLIHALTVCPNGVYRMIPEMPDVVETSNNLAIVTTEKVGETNDGKEYRITVLCLTRSSVESRKEEMQSMLESCFALAGAKVEFSGSYPGWKPNLHSNILGTMLKVYEQEFQEKPRIITIHAGLECGIIGRNYPGMDMISFGPTIKHPHSPSEKVNIKTVEKFYHFLLATLKEC